MKGAKVMKLALDDFGSFLSRKEGCLVIKDREGNTERYPLGENQIGEIQVRSGNGVSTRSIGFLCFLGHRRYSANVKRESRRCSK